MPSRQFELDLPPIRLSSSKGYGFDRYGFNYFLATEVGLDIRFRRSFCDWIHGWIWWDELAQHEDYFGPVNYRRSMRLIVSSLRQKGVLESAGYSNVLVGGLPFSYYPRLGLERVAGSVLAFPKHGAESVSRRSDSRFIDYLVDLKSQGICVSVCIFGVDWNEAVIERYTSAGLNPIFGAHPRDINALLRVGALLEMHEYSVSEEMGSQVGYAVLAGNIPKIFDGIIGNKRDLDSYRVSDIPYSEQYLERLEWVSSDDYLRAKYPELFRAGFSAPETIREELQSHVKTLALSSIPNAVGWKIRDQLKGYYEAVKLRLGCKS